MTAVNFKEFMLLICMFFYTLAYLGTILEAPTESDRSDNVYAAHSRSLNDAFDAGSMYSEPAIIVNGVQIQFTEAVKDWEGWTGPASPNAYEILGVDYKASHNAIEHAQLALHGKVAPGGVVYHENSKIVDAITLAWDQLKNDYVRCLYDFEFGIREGIWEGLRSPVSDRERILPSQLDQYIPLSLNRWLHVFRTGRWNIADRVSSVRLSQGKKNDSRAEAEKVGHNEEEELLLYENRGTFEMVRSGDKKEAGGDRSKTSSRGGV